MKPIAELVAAIRERGGRITPQRIAVIEVIKDSCNHPSIDEIYEEVVKTQKSLSRKTVYQIVNDLNEIGAISLVDVGTGQLRVDPTIENSHDHFVCKNCHEVFDVPNSSKFSVQKNVSTIGEVDTVEVIYRGFCKTCYSKN